MPSSKVVMPSGARNLIVDILSKIIASIASGLILALPTYLGYYNNNLPYKDVIKIFHIIIFCIVLLVIAILMNKSLKKPITKDKKENFHIPTWVPIIILIIIISIFVCIYPHLFPLFKIIEPKDGSSITDTTTVSGQGAIPGSQVILYDTDKYGHLWKIGTATPTQDGLWECNNVSIGQYGTQYAGQSFTIFANLTTYNKSYETSHIYVIRS